MIVKVKFIYYFYEKQLKQFFLGLKKCIDQIYNNYLPKNMHPFVYLSLELDPKNVDVNVHPTKHEVHFLNEEQIVEAITTAMESKLLGSNDSRIFYTQVNWFLFSFIKFIIFFCLFLQSKLPGTEIETAKISATEESSPNKSIHAKDLVRTDRNEQKLEKFFGNPTRKNDSNPPPKSETNHDESDVEILNTTKENKHFESLVINDTPKKVVIQEKPATSQTKLSQISKISRQV